MRKKGEYGTRDCSICMNASDVLGADLICVRLSLGVVKPQEKLKCIKYSLKHVFQLEFLFKVVSARVNFSHFV